MGLAGPQSRSGLELFTLAVKEDRQNIMIATIVVGILFLFFIYVSYMSFQVWRGWHVALMFGIFVFTLLFAALSAMSLKTRSGWKKKYDETVASLEKEHNKLERLTYGSLLTDDDVKSVSSTQGELKRSILDRGRVWRGAQPAGVAEDGSFVLDMSQWGDDRCLGSTDEEPFTPAADPAADEAAEGATVSATHGITTDLMLYAFLEANPQGGSPERTAALFGSDQALLSEPGEEGTPVCSVPVFYVGGFRVTASEGNRITLTPTMRLAPDQLEQAQAGAHTWALYEVLPIDSHSAFAGVTREQLEALFSGSADSQQIVSEYAQDLQPVEGNPEDARTQRLVKFLKPAEFVVDVEGEREGMENFDPSGRAVAAHLKQGQPTKFNEGDVCYFDTETALRLEREGTVQLESESPRYVRRLRDYGYFYHEKIGQIQELLFNISTVVAENNAITDATEKAQTQIAYRENEIKELGEDNTHLQGELATLKKVQSELNIHAEKQRRALSSLYHWNIQQADQLRGPIFHGDSH